MLMTMTNDVNDDIQCLDVAEDAGLLEGGGHQVPQLSVLLTGAYRHSADRRLCKQKNCTTEGRNATFVFVLNV